MRGLEEADDFFPPRLDDEEPVGLRSLDEVEELPSALADVLGELHRDHPFDGDAVLVGHRFGGPREGEMRVRAFVARPCAQEVLHHPLSSGAKPVVNEALARDVLHQDIMSRREDILQQLLLSLRERSMRMKNACYADEITVTRTKDAVEVLVRWKYKGGGYGEYRKTFGLQELLGDTFLLHEHAWRVQKKPCACARDVISGVLQQRGV